LKAELKDQEGNQRYEDTNATLDKIIQNAEDNELNVQGNDLNKIQNKATKKGNRFQGGKDNTAYEKPTTKTEPEKKDLFKKFQAAKDNANKLLLIEEKKRQEDTRKKLLARQKETPQDIVKQKDESKKDTNNSAQDLDDVFSKALASEFPEGKNKDNDDTPSDDNNTDLQIPPGNKDQEAIANADKEQKAAKDKLENEYGMKVDVSEDQHDLKASFTVKSGGVEDIYAIHIGKNLNGDVYDGQYLKQFFKNGNRYQNQHSQRLDGKRKFRKS